MRRSLAVLFLLLGTAGLTACGDDSPSDAGDGSPSAGSTQGGAEQDVTEPDEGGEEEPAPAAGPEDICALVTAEEMTEVMGGGPLTVSADPLSGCNFSDEEDPRAPSIALNQMPLTPENGGFDATKFGVQAVIDGEVEDLDGIGDAAFVVVGPALGGTSVSGGGAVALGDTVVQVTLLAGGQLDADQVREATVGALTLIASKA